jgi:hypothetical protein
MELLEEMGLADAEMLETLEGLEKAGLSRGRFPIEGLGHYVELIGELARREVRHFTRHAEGMPADELVALAERAVQVTEPLIAVIRRRLMLRAIRAELDRTNHEKERP